MFPFREHTLANSYCRNGAHRARRLLQQKMCPPLIRVQQLARLAEHQYNRRAR